MIANASARIDEVERGPVLVLECAPDRIVVVDDDRIVDLHLLHGAANVVEILLECKLRSVRAETHEILLVLLTDHARTYGSVRSQLMQVYVQKLTTTTFPNSCEGASRGELSHSVARPMAASSRGTSSCASAVPSMPNCEAAIVIAAVLTKRRRSRLMLTHLLTYLRSDLKPARTSSEKIFGCSHAAKWPPFSTLL